MSDDRMGRDFDVLVITELSTFQCSGKKFEFHFWIERYYLKDLVHQIFF